MGKVFTGLCAFDASYPGVLAGVDEAGRGPWAGPVVAAAVVLLKEKIPTLIEINDSKKLSEKKREELYNIVINACSVYAISEISHEIIDSG